MTAIFNFDNFLVPSHVNNSGTLYIPAQIRKGKVEVFAIGEYIFISVYKDTKEKHSPRYISIGKARVKEFFSRTNKTTWPVVLQKDSESDIRTNFKIVFYEEEYYSCWPVK